MTEYITNYKYTVVYDRESIFETVIARLFSRVQIVPLFGVDEFLSLDLTGGKFSYTPEVILFGTTMEHAANAFLLKGFPRVTIFTRGVSSDVSDSKPGIVYRHIDEIADKCVLTRSDFVMANFISILLTYDQREAKEYVSVEGADDFMLTIAGGVVSDNRAEFTSIVAAKIIEQLNASIGIGGIERINAMSLSGGVIRNINDCDIDVSLKSSFSYMCGDVCVVVITTRNSAHRIAKIARDVYDLSKTIIVNVCACGSSDSGSGALPQWHVTVINETPHEFAPNHVYTQTQTSIDATYEWLFGSETKSISYTTIRKKNDIIEILYGV